MTISVRRIADCLSVDQLASLADGDLAAFLPRQRWFGGKGGPITRAMVTDVVALPWDDKGLAIAIVEVTTTAGTARYQLPLAVREVGPALGDLGKYAIAQLKADDGTAQLVDAALDPVFQRKLGEAMGQRCEFPSERGGSWSTEPIAKAPPSITADMD